MHDYDWMRAAYQQALQAAEYGEVPVGAVIVDDTQRLLSSAFNQTRRKQNPCAHAEILAIQSACQAVGNHRLNNTTLYVTLEPCAMCAGAIVQARIARMVFATRDLKAGAAGSVYNLLQGYPLNHRVIIDEGIMQEPCAALLSDFFKTRRANEANM